MRRTNWESVSQSVKTIKKNVKNIQQAGEFLRDFPPEGYMRDNNNGKMVEIKDEKTKSSSLRRYVKLLDNFYYLAESESDRKKILNKKIEVETELNNRPSKEEEELQKLLKKKKAKKKK